jgi:gephyrin
MSRPVAGVRNQTLIITLPGSPKGAKENLEAIIKLLPHACVQAAGANSRQIHAGGTKKLEREAGLSGNASSLPSRPAGTEDILHSKKSCSSRLGHSHHHHHHHHGSAGGHTGPVPHPEVDNELHSNDIGAGPSQRHRESAYPMVSVDEALQMIAKYTPPSTTAKVPVNGDLVGCVLAEDVIAAESVPAFRASIVDGYAVSLSRYTSSPVMSNVQHLN